ncbi:hypothetical protein WN55_09713 [Dufourea novaeangliae]|uniref:Uncharacterized protein n=1 Tax=Dufourea novaeangliae TaxID=178035 RepID=A0A154P0N4_DUFNO|nr:hypothetical protein WN55_09713 [Dufourea novaeangliae]
MRPSKGDVGPVDRRKCFVVLRLRIEGLRDRDVFTCFNPCDEYVILNVEEVNKVTPAERRVPEKEETWTLAPDQEDPCTFYEVSDKPKGSQDVEASKIPEVPTDVSEPPESGSTLPRNQESRKSKTKKVKNYLRKCKGALSKGDEGSTEKKRQEHCTSWYLEQSQSPLHEEPDVVPLEKPEETISDERIAEVVEVTVTLVEVDNAASPIDTLTNPPKDHETPDEALARLLDEDRRNDLRRSRTSLYEDARDSISDQATTTDEPECPSKVAREKTEAVSLETLTTEDTNLNKCDSSDTLIAEVAEGVYATTHRSVDAEQGKEDGNEETLQALSLLGGRGDVASLVRNLLGPIYGDGVINLLIRQARDILVCAYHGNLENFLKTYLSPAASLLAEVKSVASETQGQQTSDAYAVPNKPKHHPNPNVP